MKSALLHKRAFTGYPKEVELLESGGDRLFEVDSLRQPGQRMLVALAEDGTVDYPVYDPDKDKVSWKFDDRFGKKFKSEVKKHMQGEVEAAETPEEEEEATNDPALRKAAVMKKCVKCRKERSVNRDGICHECEQAERDEKVEKTADVIEPDAVLPDEWDAMIAFMNTLGWHKVGYSTFYPPQAAMHAIRIFPHHWDYSWFDKTQRKGETLAELKNFIATSGLRKFVRKPQKPGTTIDVEPVPPKALPPRSGAASKTAATVHDVKPLIDTLRTTDDPDKSIALTEQLLAISKQIGAREIYAAARHYLDTQRRCKEHRERSGVVMPRTMRAVERAWKRLEAAYVHYVR